jgi:hypothetical protein
MRSIAALFLFVGSALPPALPPTLAGADGAAGRAIDCYCTDRQGARVELGQSICLDVGGRRFTAQCQMSLNVPMWREISNGCLSSSLSGRFGAGQTLPQSTVPTIDPVPVHTQI